MRLTQIFLLIFLCASVYGQESQSFTINFDGQSREYRLFIPSDYDETDARPLVFALHGFTNSAETIENRSQFNTIADTANFFVCYPNGIGRAWNVGWQFGSTADDVGFFDALIDTLSENFNINQNRIYSTGFSNGGFMSHRLACELNNRIAAVASVAGGFAPDYFENCNPERAVPVMQIHGNFDFVVPINGGLGITIPIEEVVNFWVENNACNSDFSTTSISSLVELRDWENCAPNSTVRYFEIERGGHNWPGSSDSGSNQDIDASLEIWEFFRQYELNQTSSNENRQIVNSINVSPNPTSNLLNFNRLVDAYQIFNAYGQIVATGEVAETITVSDLPSGIYFGTLESDNNLFQFTFVKN